LTIKDTDTDLAPSVRIISPTVDTVYLTTTNATLVLEATVADDGAPNPPGHITSSWSVRSGPGTALFGDTNSLQTIVRFPIAGVYQLRLTASDGTHQAASDLTVMFDADTNVNFAPVVAAGAPSTNEFGEMLYLAGTVTDDGNPTPPGSVSMAWSKLSGPGVVVFGDASSASSTAEFSEPGTYVLCLRADDGEVKICDEVTVAVVVLPTVTIHGVETNAFELGEREGRFLVSRSGETNAHLDVHLTVNGTASNGVDYAIIEDVVTIPAGSASALITVTPFADALPEGDETVVLALGSSPLYESGNPSMATVLIRDAPWDAWRFNHFSPAELEDPNISGEDADPDQDGQANIFEYAFNLDPHVPETNRVFVINVEISPLDNEPYFVLNFKRRLPPSDMIYEVFVSDDLIHWESGTTYVQELAPATNDGNNVTETVRVRVKDPIAQTPRRFVKLGVRRP
jgi:hypothetical protein